MKVATRLFVCCLYRFYLRLFLGLPQRGKERKYGFR